MIHNLFNSVSVHVNPCLRQGRTRASLHILVVLILVLVLIVILRGILCGPSIVIGNRLATRRLVIGNVRNRRYSMVSLTVDLENSIDASVCGYLRGIVLKEAKLRSRENNLADFVRSRPTD